MLTLLPTTSGKSLSATVILASVFAGSITIAASSATAKDSVQFNLHIRPILAEHCLNCHGPDAEHRQGDLRLDIESAAKASAIRAGMPADSPLIERITSTDADVKMPPPDTGKSLTAQELKLLRQWISEGASYQGHWSFEPIQRPVVPDILSDPAGINVSDTSSDIDRFIVAELQTRQLSLSPKIDRRQLIRRASFDLTGLPPSWEDVEEFVSDTAPDAVENLIDRLLASPHYGERWGRHWLDLARYADTHGGAAIGFTKFPFSYTYRDYVINAFNEDVPYDRFVTEQLAADQLGLDDHDPALAGVGFLTIGMQFRNRHDVIDDQIDVVTRGLMGLTVACARCHDHKYDAIPTADYYSLYATFASSKSPDPLPLIGTQSDEPSVRDYMAELSRRQVIHEDMARDQSEVMRSRLRMQVGLYLRELARGTPEQDLSAAFLSYPTDDLRPLVLNRWRDYIATISQEDPVFGPWMKLRTLDASKFADNCDRLVRKWQEENGDPAKFANQQSLSVPAPKWNPRVLDAIARQKPVSLLDVADAYGSLFADVHQQWLKSLLDATLEAVSEDTIVPDEDARHAEINSAVNKQLRRHLYHPDTPTAMPDDVAITLLNRTVRDNLGGRKGAIHDLHLSSPGSPPRAMVLQENAQASEFHVFRRGNPIDRAEPVSARFLTALSSAEAQPFEPGRRRLGLALAVVSPENPLTRRVIVNWIWQHHFGQGLVRTPDDFGTRGRTPTHPALLDYLASSFLEDGWSIKQMHKRIMLTDVYQQAAAENSFAREVDPDNELLWRMPRRRLDLEAMRDAMLAVSGELNEAMGGKPFDLLSMPTIPRRSVYAFINRDIVNSLASTFDVANPNSCTAKRPETTVPQQSLFALNSEFIQDRGAALAALSAIAAANNDEDRICWLYQRVFSRIPKPDELQAALDFLNSTSQPTEIILPASDTVPQSAGSWQQLAHVLLAANEFVFVD